MHRANGIPVAAGSPVAEQGLHGGALGPSTASRVLSNAPSTRQALDNVPAPGSQPASQGPSFVNGPKPANPATGAPLTPTLQRLVSPPAPAPIAPDAEDALSQAAGFRGGSSAPSNQAPSSTAATASSVVNSYRQGMSGDYNTQQANNDYVSGKITKTQLDQVYAATNPGAAPARAPVTSQSAQDAANTAAERAHPSTPPGGGYGLIASAPAPGGGGTVTAPSDQPQAAPADGGSGISVGGVPMNKNANGTFVAGAPTASPGNSAPGSSPGAAPLTFGQQKALAAQAYPQLLVPGSPENAKFVAAWTAGGSSQTGVLDLANSLFGGNSGGAVKDAAAPTPALLGTASGQSSSSQLSASIPRPQPGGPTPLPAGTAAAQTPNAPSVALNTGAPAAPAGTGFADLDRSVNRATTGIANLGSTITAGDIRQPTAASTPPAVNSYLANNPTMASTVTNPNASPAAPTNMVGGYNIAAFPSATGATSTAATTPPPAPTPLPSPVPLINPGLAAAHVAPTPVAGYVPPASTSTGSAVTPVAGSTPLSPAIAGALGQSGPAVRPPPQPGATSTPGPTAPGISPSSDPDESFMHGYLHALSGGTMAPIAAPAAPAVAGGGTPPLLRLPNT
jgi:hypothetical protein